MPRMDEIDVVEGEKGKFKVLLNSVRRGVEYSSKALANKQAELLGQSLPNVKVNLMG